MTDAKRRFTLLDIIVLIAALAAGFALARPGLAYLRLGSLSAGGGTVGHYLGVTLLFGTPSILMSSLAVLLLSLRAPRPPLCSLLQQPGIIVNIAGLSGALTSLILSIGNLIHYWNNLHMYFMNSICGNLPGVASGFVMGSLVTLALIRRPLPCPSWIDRLSWILGVLWVLLLPVTWARLYLFLFSMWASVRF